MTTIHIIDAFTTEAGKGNRAGVVFEADTLTPETMQAMAAFAGFSETAFILGSSDPSTHDYRIRYFTPTKEVPVCGHATIASIFGLSAHKPEGLHQTVRIQVANNTPEPYIIPIDREGTGTDTVIVMTQRAAQFGALITGELRTDLAKALGIPETDFLEGAPIQIVDTGHSKVMIPLKSRTTLNALTPNMAGLLALSGTLDCNGFFPFCIEGHETHGRMFAPAIGIDEDPVTGNANGPAGAYIAHHGLLKRGEGKVLRYNGHQGAAMGKPGTVDVRITTHEGSVTKVQVAGHAIEAGVLEYDRQ